MGVCAVAIWRGGGHERLAAGGLLAGWALTMVAYRKDVSLEWGILIIDLALLALLVWLALRSRRYWPMFAAAFQLLAVLTHAASSADSSVSSWAYITAEIIWGYLLAGAVAYGALTVPRRGESSA